MVFYETGIFTSQIVGLLSDESYRELQNQIVANPESGDFPWIARTPEDSLEG